MDKFKFYTNDIEKKYMKRFYFIFDEKNKQYEYIMYNSMNDFYGYSYLTWLPDPRPFLVKDEYIKEFDLKHKFIKGIFSDDFTIE